MLRDTSLLGAVLWSTLVVFTKGDSNKTRLCIEYEMDDYNSTMTPLKTLTGVTRAMCIAACAHHQQDISPCRSVHFRPTEDICELLPEAATCMVDNTTPGTTYVHLADCETVVPYRGIKPNPGPLQWVADSNGALSLTSPQGGVKYGVRVLHKGMWLVGYGSTSDAHVAGPDGVTVTCTSNIQYIKASTSYRWVPFSVGDPVPTTAIVASQWPGGSPLYIIQVATIEFGTVYVAYYNAQCQKIRPLWLTSFQPGSMEILVTV